MTEVGGALRNAWKVSARSGRLWTDNPPYLITIPLPTSLIPARLSFSQISNKASLPFNTC